MGRHLIWRPAKNNICRLHGRHNVWHEIAHKQLTPPSRKEDLSREVRRAVQQVIVERINTASFKFR